MRPYKPYASKAFRDVLSSPSEKGAGMDEFKARPEDREEIKAAQKEYAKKSAFFSRPAISLRALLLALAVNILLVLGLNWLVKADFPQSPLGRICYIFLSDNVETKSP